MQAFWKSTEKPEQVVFTEQNDAKSDFFNANLCENVTRYKDFNQKFDPLLNFSFNIWNVVDFFKGNWLVLKFLVQNHAF